MAAGSGSAGNNSPRHLMDNQQSRPSMKPVSWNQVVRGESEHMLAAPSSPLKATTVASAVLVEAAVDSSSPSCSSPLAATDSSSFVVVESSDGGIGTNDELHRNAVKKPAWNRLSNGVPTESEPIVGWNDNWPALSKSTVSSSKSSSSSDLIAKGSADADGSSIYEPIAQGIGPIPSVPQRQTSDHSSTNPVVTARNKFSKQNAFSNGGHQPQSVLLGHSPTTSLNNSPKERTQRSGQSHNVSDHQQQQRSSFRYRSGGTHHRGDGSHHQSFGGRRDQDREQNVRKFNGQDNHLRGGPKFMRPLLPSPVFIPPPTLPIGSPLPYPTPTMVYFAAPPHDPFSGVPFMAPVPPHMMFGPPQDPLLLSKIVSQIDYYFSNENLVKDLFLRRNMDDEGWVPVDLIARFNKVIQLTANILNVPLILDAVRSSSVVEVQGDKIRRRDDWSRWIMPPKFESTKLNGPTTNEKSIGEALVDQVGRIELERSSSRNSAENQVDDQAETFDMQTTFGVHNSQLQPSGGEVAGKVRMEASPDQTN